MRNLTHANLSHTPKYRIRLLRTTPEFQAYFDGYRGSFAGRKAVGQTYMTPEQLPNFSHVFGLFGPDGELVGGYIMNLNRNSLRSLTALTPTERSSFLRELDQNPQWRVGEVTALWKKSGVDYTREVWPHIVQQCLTNSCTHMLGTVYPDHGMKENYLRLKPRILHEGYRDQELTVLFTRRLPYVTAMLIGIGLRFVKPKGNLKNAVH